MQLRLDLLLDDLRRRGTEILAAIDADPLLLKRESADLVLANASQKLFTPQAEHQLFAKGIVYRRDPFRLVSLPLVKIYNVGERDVAATELTAIAAEPGTRLRYLRKLDGSLVQFFRHDGKTWITTRGMIEGGRIQNVEPDEVAGFDYLGQARRLAREKYPALLDDPACLEGRTLVFEILHPAARVITNYGDREDLVLTACFDHATHSYIDHESLVAHAARFGLTAVDALSPAGATIEEQIEDLRASMAGTDQEGSVLCFEREGMVVYRVKAKTADYLQLMKLMAFCTYPRTVELIEANKCETWAALRAVLQERGKNNVPEEVLVFYEEHWARHQAYLAMLPRIGAWAIAQRDAILARVAAGDRRAFAAEATRMKRASLVFAALDNRVDVPRLRRMIGTPEEAQELADELGV